MHKGDAVLDIGCSDGAMFEQWSGLMGRGYGVDPTLSATQSGDGYTLYPGKFPEALPSLKCDVITMLAVLEHIPPSQQPGLAASCHRLLNPGGRVVITVPSAHVDRILHLLSGLRVIDGMSIEEHYGFEAEKTVEIFGGSRFQLVCRERFQLGLNNLFVFEKGS